MAEVPYGKIWSELKSPYEMKRFIYAVNARSYLAGKGINRYKDTVDRILTVP